MAVISTTENEGMKLTLNYGESSDGKIVTKSKTYSDLKIGITNEAFMATVNALASLMTPTIDQQKHIVTNIISESE